MISAKESILGPFEMKHLAKVVEDNYHFVKNGNSNEIKILWYQYDSKYKKYSFDDLIFV